MKGTIDRLEGTIAVVELEDKTTINIDKINLPSSIKEGDVIFFNDKNIIIDKIATKKVNIEINNLMNKLFEQE